MKPMQFFGHPFSSYTQKALIAFYENDIGFTFRHFFPLGAPDRD